MPVSSAPFDQIPLWGFGLSIVSLALSQLPPIKTWFSAPHVSAEVASRTGVFNAFGAVGYQLYVSLRNDGNRAASVTGLRLRVKRPDGQELLVPAEAYMRFVGGQGGSQVFPVTSIGMPSGGTWTETVMFRRPLTPEEDSRAGRLKVNIAQSIFEGQQRGDGRHNPNGWAVADAALVREAELLFQKTELSIGSYELALMADVNGRESVLKRLSLVIYDYHLLTLSSQMSDLKYGAGITMPMNPAKELWVITSNLT